jgi:hypothetical protein
MVAASRALSPWHTTKKSNGRRYRYYIPMRDTKEQAGASVLPRLPAAELESAVLEQLRGILRAPALLGDLLSQALTLSGIDPLLLTKTDPPGRHGYARENAAHTAIPERTRLYAASRVRCAGLQKPQPALDPAPRRKPGCWRAPTVGQFS